MDHLKSGLIPLVLFPIVAAGFGHDSLTEIMWDILRVIDNWIFGGDKYFRREGLTILLKFLLENVVGGSKDR